MEVGSHIPVSRRTERVASLVRAILAQAIQNRLSDSRIEPLTSITRVEISADLSVAHVYVSVMAEQKRRELTLRALRHAAGRLRSLVAHEITLRQTPQIEFRLDESVQQSFRTVQQIDGLMEELGERAEPDSGPRSEDREAAEPGVDEKTRLGGRGGGVPPGQEGS